MKKTIYGNLKEVSPIFTNKAHQKQQTLTVMTDEQKLIKLTLFENLVQKFMKYEETGLFHFHCKIRASEGNNGKIIIYYNVCDFNKE